MMSEPDDAGRQEESSYSQRQRRRSLEVDPQESTKAQPQIAMNSLEKNNQALADAIDRESYLAVEITQLESLLEEANSSLEEAVEGSVQLEAQIDDLSGQLERRQEEMDSMAAENQQLLDEKGSLESTKAQPQITMNSLETNNQALADAIDRESYLAVEITQLESLLEEANSSLEEAVEGSNQLETQIDDLSGQLERRQEEIDSMEAENQQLLDDKGRMEIEKEKLSFDLQHATDPDAANLEEANRQIADLASQIEAKEQELNSMLAENQRLVNEKAQMETETERLMSEFASREESKKQDEQLTAQIEVQRQEIDTILAENQRLVDEKATMELAAEKLKSNLQDASDKGDESLEASKKHIETLVMQIEWHQQAIDLEKSESQRHMGEKASIEMQAEKLKSELAAFVHHQSMALKLQNNVEMLDAEKQRLVATLQTREKEFEELKSRELSTLKDSNHMSEALVKEASNKNREISMMSGEIQRCVQHVFCSKVLNGAIQLILHGVLFLW
jgi:chromosome segregation ATPase